jgi:hypothetical protein
MFFIYHTPIYLDIFDGLTNICIIYMWEMQCISSWRILFMINVKLQSKRYVDEKLMDIPYIIVIK